MATRIIWSILCLTILVVNSARPFQIQILICYLTCSMEKQSESTKIAGYELRLNTDSDLLSDLSIDNVKWIKEEFRSWKRKYYAVITIPEKMKMYYRLLLYMTKNLFGPLIIDTILPPCHWNGTILLLYPRTLLYNDILHRSWKDIVNTSDPTPNPKLSTLDC